MQIVLNKGICEKAYICNGASDACRTAVFAENMICAPEKRWMYCHAFKQRLGLIFDRDLGVYILPKCPCCGADLKKHLVAKL